MDNAGIRTNEMEEVREAQLMFLKETDKTVDGSSTPAVASVCTNRYEHRTRGLNGGRIRLEIIEQPWCGRSDLIEFFLYLGLHLLAQCRGSSRARVATCRRLRSPDF